MNPLETIMELLPFLADDELKIVTDFIAQRRRANQPVTDKPKRYPYVFVCAGCRRLADSERSDTITCSPACRVRSSRNGFGKGLRKLAKQWDVKPASILQSEAAEWLIDDVKRQIMHREITLNDIRGDIWRAYWALVEKSMEAAP